MTSPQRTSPRPLNGYHVLMGLVGFFLIVFAVNGIMIYKAESTFGGLDTDNAYRKGVNYNDRIAAAEAQAKLGWQDRIDYVPETKHLRVSLTDKAGSAVSGLTVTAGLERATTNRYDQRVSLNQTGRETYEVDVSALEPGWWIVDLRAHRGDEGAPLYEARRRLWIKP